MKKFLFATALIISTLLTSCNKDGENYAMFQTYVTVCADASLDEGIYFENDFGQTYYVATNATNTDLTEIPVGARKFITVKAYASTISEYDRAITLNGIYDVETGECTSVSSQEQSDAILDLPLKGIDPNIMLGQGLLNIHLVFSSDDIMNNVFYLVENTFAELDEDIEIDEDYACLELRIATTNEDKKGKSYEQFVTFDLEPFRDILEDKKGIVLRLNTETNDIVYHTVSSFSIFPEEK